MSARWKTFLPRGCEWLQRVILLYSHRDRVGLMERHRSSRVSATLLLTLIRPHSSRGPSEDTTPITPVTGTALLSVMNCLRKVLICQSSKYSYIDFYYISPSSSSYIFFYCMEDFEMIVGPVQQHRRAGQANGNPPELPARSVRTTCTESKTRELAHLAERTWPPSFTT